MEKDIQCFKIGNVLKAVNAIKTLIERKENEEMLALYNGGYVLPKSTKIVVLQYGIVETQKGVKDM